MDVSEEDRPLIQLAMQTRLPGPTSSVKELAEWVSLVANALVALYPTTKTDKDQMEIAHILLCIAKVQEVCPFTIDKGGLAFYDVVNKLRQSIDMNVASISRTVFARMCDLDTFHKTSHPEMDDWRKEAWMDLTHPFPRLQKRKRSE